MPQLSDWFSENVFHTLGILHIGTADLETGRHRMDPIGFILLGMVTAIGGGSLRVILLDRPVFWTEAPEQQVIAIIAALIINICMRPPGEFFITYLKIKIRVSGKA